MTQPNRIALVATMHSGKTEIARRLIDDYKFKRFALADGVKDATVDMINAFLQHIGCDPTMTREKLEKDKASLRWLLQGVGTELGRNYVGPESIWIDFFLNKVNAHDGPIVCDDCRFPNEAQALRAAGFTIVRIVRPEEERQTSIRRALTRDLLSKGIMHEADLARAIDDEMSRAASHPSETNVALIEPDLTVMNTTFMSLATIAVYLAKGKTPPAEVLV